MFSIEFCFFLIDPSKYEELSKPIGINPVILESTAVRCDGNVIVDGDDDCVIILEDE